LIVSESGIATDDDRQRVRYIDRSLAAADAAVADGVDVRGFLYWSALDNFEWQHGYAQRFGLIGVDRATLARTVKPSARHFGQIARRRRSAQALEQRP
jgi:beta-glucosidase